MELIKHSLYMNLIVEDRWRLIVDGLGVTLYLTILSFIFGTIFGAIFCALRYSKIKFIRKLTFTIVQIFIRVPCMILLYAIVYGIFSESSLSLELLAVFGFTLKVSSYMCDIFYTATLAVRKGEIEAARSLGMGKVKTFIYIILPQTIKYAKELYTNEFILTLQETSIAGYIAVNELTRVTDIISTRTFDPFTSLIIVAIIYLIIGQIAAYIINFLFKERHMKGAN